MGVVGLGQRLVDNLVVRATTYEINSMERASSLVRKESSDGGSWRK